MWRPSSPPAAALPSGSATWAPAAAALAANVYENSRRVIISMFQERGCRCEVMAAWQVAFGDNQTFRFPRFKPVAGAMPSDFTRNRLGFKCSKHPLRRMSMAWWLKARAVVATGDFTLERLAVSVPRRRSFRRGRARADTAMRPNFCQIEPVQLVCRRYSLEHHLNRHPPSGRTHIEKAGAQTVFRRVCSRRLCKSWRQGAICRITERDLSLTSTPEMPPSASRARRRAAQHHCRWRRTK